jgi:hypothetical protein
VLVVPAMWLSADVFVNYVDLGLGYMMMTSMPC